MTAACRGCGSGSRRPTARRRRSGRSDLYDDDLKRRVIAFQRSQQLARGRDRRRGDAPASVDGRARGDRAVARDGVPIAMSYILDALRKAAEQRGSTDSVLFRPTPVQIGVARTWRVPWIVVGGLLVVNVAVLAWLFRPMGGPDLPPPTASESSASPGVALALSSASAPPIRAVGGPAQHGGRGAPAPSAAGPAVPPPTGPPIWSRHHMRRQSRPTPKTVPPPRPSSDDEPSDADRAASDRVGAAEHAAHRRARAPERSAYGRAGAAGVRLRSCRSGRPFRQRSSRRRHRALGPIAGPG